MSKHMSIPAIRKRLYELADQTGLDELRELADASYRRPAIRVAPRRVGKPTEAQQAEVIRLADLFKHMPMREIATRVGIDQGRVSEILNKEARRAD